MKFRLLGLGLLAVVLISGQAKSAIQLGILIDASGSINVSDPNNFDNLKADIAAAINAVIPVNSSVEITVVKFSTSATTVVSPTLIDSVATRTAVSNLISSMFYDGGVTQLDDGIALLNAEIDNSSLHDPNNSIIYNIVTDGEPCCGATDAADAVAQRNAALAPSIGVDEIDAEFIGNIGSAGYNFLLNQIVAPQPGAPAPPYEPGFVVAVSFDNFEDAFTAKLDFIITNNEVPEISSFTAWASLGAFGMIGAYRRRRRTVA